VALYHADYTPDAIVPMAAASRDQTGILLNQAAGFVRRTPGMDRRFRVYEGYRRIDALRTRGRIQVFAADDRTGDGVIFTLALLEELHRHPDLRLYRTWHGKIEKRGGQVVAISTAGEPGGEYENVKAGVLKRGRVRRRGAHTVARTRELVLHQHALAPGDDLHDLKRVKQANPFSGVTIAGLKRKHDSPTMLESHWARFVCGIPTRSQQSAITAAEWERLKKAKIPATADVFAGVDLGWKWDTTAIVPLWMADERRRVLGIPEVIVPPRDGTSTDPEEIRAAARRVNDRHEVHTWVVEDAAGAAQFVEWLETEFPDARVVPTGPATRPPRSRSTGGCRPSASAGCSTRTRPAHAARPQRGRQARRPGPLPLRPAAHHPPRPRPGPARHRLPVSGERRACRRGRRRRARPRDRHRRLPDPPALIVALIALAALLIAAFALVAVMVLRLAPGPVRTGDG
jgi:hypothetical protein